jgi:phosphatidylserine decarboxylase
MDRRRLLKMKVEQIRQSKRIHGGLMKLLVALIGIRLARMKIPSERLRASLYRKIFEKKYPPGLNEAEAEHPLGRYPTLNAVFTRGIKPELRPLANGASQFLCPCDGTIQAIGRIQPDTLIQAKGVEYRLQSLAPHVDPRPFADGHFAVIFLSPIDCHRVFSPYNAQLDEAIHVPGYRLLVHPPYQRADYPVYTLNERLILRFSTDLGPFLVVMVAGWGVGNMTLPIDRTFRPRSNDSTSKTWTQPLTVQKGDWIGTFELGSTIVLLTPPGSEVTQLVAANEKIKYGQPLFCYAD